jgi:hypothetical protein
MDQIVAAPLEAPMFDLWGTRKKLRKAQLANAIVEGKTMALRGAKWQKDFEELGRGAFQLRNHRSLYASILTSSMGWQKLRRSDRKRGT